MEIFSKHHKSFQLLLIPGVCLAFLLLAEMTTRAAASEEKLPSPEPFLWHRREVVVKIQQLQDAAPQGDLDMLIAGSSVAYTGVDPTALNEAFELAAGAPLRSYNTGLAALSFEVNELFLERVFLRNVQPSFIVLPLSPRDFNQNNPITKGVDQEAMASDYGRAILREGVESEITSWLLEYSSFYRYRNMLALGLWNGLRFPDKLPISYDDPAFDRLGFVPGKNNLDQAIAKGYDIDPSNAAKRSLQNFKMGKANMAALERLLLVCQQQGIQLILINMPMTDYLMQGFDHPETDYQAYLDQITHIGQAYGLQLWDFNQAPFRQMFTNADFGDIFHLNAQGAGKISTELASIIAELISREKQTQ